ncbi:MAG: hypothetical protein HYW50_04620 [Candidatus Diapherotrites archaeon]|nr:hypothetical protein [Candidatus Diapherotrites archaeon]
MNSKGIFSLVFLVFFLIIIIKSGQLQQTYFEKLLESRKLLLEMEKAGFRRAELETNFDFLVKESITLNALKDSDGAKFAVNEEIEKFVSKTKNIYGKKIEFGFQNKNSRKSEGFSKQKMKELFSMHTSIQNRSADTQFTFTGGMNKEELLNAEILSKNFSQDFYIAPDYTVKAVISLEG